MSCKICEKNFVFLPQHKYIKETNPVELRPLVGNKRN